MIYADKGTLIIKGDDSTVKAEVTHILHTIYNKLVETCETKEQADEAFAYIGRLAVKSEEELVADLKDNLEELLGGLN